MNDYVEFNANVTMFVNPEDIKDIYIQMKQNISFDEAFDLVVAGWDDYDYYLSDNIKEQVKDYIEKHYGYRK